MASDAEYMKDYRSRNRGYRDRNNALNSARSKALRKLAERHPAEFAELLEAEKRKAGVS
jgi:succinate dehydrogenase flavin-adding protein (antitoxin of CptAB toxin-antitoxin module)